MSDPIFKSEGIFGWQRVGTSSEADEYVGGLLEIYKDGTTLLALTGLLSDVDGAMRALFSRTQLDENIWIFGALKDTSRGRYVYLGRMSTNGVSLGNDLSHQAFRARDCIVTHEYINFSEPVQVQELTLSLNDLNDWAAKPAVQVRKTQRGITIQAYKSKSREFLLPGRKGCFIANLKYTGHEGMSYLKASVTQDTRLQINPDHPISLSLVREECMLIEDLMLLLSDVNVVMPWPRIRVGGTVGTYYYERTWTAEDQKVEWWKAWAATLSSIKAKEFGRLLTALQDQRNVLGPGMYLYFGLRRGKGLYKDNQFAMAIFGLESLHRRVNTSSKDARLEAKIERILGDVKLSKDRTWLRGRFKSAHEPALSERLFQTFSELKIELEERSLKEFSVNCAALRNEIAHFGGQRDRDANYDEFFQKMCKLYQGVIPLYHAVLLNRIGYNMKRIHAFFHVAPYSPRRKSEMSLAGLQFANRRDTPCGDTPVL